MATKKKRKAKRGGLPELMRHSSGQARVCLSGQMHYCGPFGSDRAQARYTDLLKQWLDGGRKALRQVSDCDKEKVRAMREVFAAWESHLDATGRYVKRGKPTSQRAIVAVAVREFVDRFGDVLRTKFDAAMLVEHRDDLLERPRLTRGGINRKVGILLEALTWAKVRKLVTREAWAECKELEPLGRHQYGYKDHKRTKRAVTAAEVEKVARVLPRHPAAMLRLQALTTMRPGEVCGMRWCDIDRSGPERDGVLYWVYTVDGAKTEHHGHATRYALGPSAQAILCEFPPRSPSATIFSPSATMSELHERRRAQRKTAVTTYTLRRDAAAEREFGNSYTTETYRQAVERACKRANVARFTPHEVRHGGITIGAKKAGTVSASAAANHSRLTTTEGYVHRGREDALPVTVVLEAEMRAAAAC